MNGYTVQISAPAKRVLDHMESSLRERILREIIQLEANPRPSGVKKLRGFEYDYRIRVGDYRVFYQIKDKQLLVIVIKITHRREAYR